LAQARQRKAALLPRAAQLAGDADSGSARSVNGGAAGMPGNRRKSCGPNALPLPGCDFAAVHRSATLPNEVLQKRGALRGRKWLT